MRRAPRPPDTPRACARPANRDTQTRVGRRREVRLGARARPEGLFLLHRIDARPPARALEIPVSRACGAVGVSRPRAASLDGRRGSRARWQRVGQKYWLAAARVVVGLRALHYDTLMRMRTTARFLARALKFHRIAGAAKRGALWRSRAPLCDQILLCQSDV